MRSLLAAFRFLTRIPLPGPETRPEDIGRAVGWFPLVGGLVGLATAAAFVGAARLWPPLAAAVLAIAFGLMLTGGFHEDGATDATDGLGGGWTRERVLEIMKDSRIGAYGSMALWCLLAFRAAALLALQDRILLAFPLAMVLGRASVALILRALPPIGTGLAKEVHRGVGWAPFLQACGLALAGVAGAWRLGLPRAGLAALCALGATLLWTAYLRRRLGGHSGDLLGAGNQLAEAGALLALMLK